MRYDFLCFCFVDIVIAARRCDLSWVEIDFKVNGRLTLPADVSVKLFLLSCFASAQDVQEIMANRIKVSKRDFLDDFTFNLLAIYSEFTK